MWKWNSSISLFVEFVKYQKVKIMKNHFANLFCVIVLSFLLFSCKDSKEEPQIRYKLKTVKSFLLHYNELDQDSYIYTPYTNVVWDKDFKGKITLQYNDYNQIVNTDYGASLYSVGTNQNYIAFSKVNIDKIQYEGDVINTEICFPFSSYLDTIKYIIKNGKLLERKVLVYDFNQKLDYIYQYEKDKIIESLNGLQTSVLYLTNSNVTKVERFQYNNAKEIISRTEFIYSDYDQSINLLKGYYYIHGAFYSAFSKNNYKNRVVNIYSYSNNQYAQISTSSLSINYNVDSNNIPDLFEYEIY
jgi:hypothetical protein